MDYMKLVPDIKNYLEKNLSADRYQHSLRVADTARNYAHRFSADCDKAYISGLSHDLCREWDEANIFSITGVSASEKFGRKIHSLLLHGKASALFLKQKWNITDESILQAIEFHTTGHPDMDNLAKIVYISDVMEPGRRYHEKVKNIDQPDLTLDELLFRILERSLKHLQDKKSLIEKASLQLYDKLEMKLGSWCE